MNKLFTLCCALLGMSAIANAQTSYSLVSDDVYSAWSSDATKMDNSGVLATGNLVWDNTFTFYNNGPSIVVNDEAGKAWTIDSSSKKWPFYGLDEVISTSYRMKSGGSCRFDSEDPTIFGPAIGVAVTGKCQIQVGAQAGSGSAWRNVGVASYDGNGNVTELFLMPSYGTLGDDYSGYLHYTYEGNATTILIYSTDSGINFGVIKVVYEGDSCWDPSSDTGEAPTTDAGDGGDVNNAISSIKADGAVEVARYNVLGQKIEGEQKGVNIVKYSDGTTAKVLVK